MVKDKKCECKTCDCQKAKPVKVRFCPECKSTDVKFVFKVKNLFGLVPRVECSKCGHNDIDFPIVVVKAENKKANKTKTKKVNKIKKDTQGVHQTGARTNSGPHKAKLVRGRK